MSGGINRIKALFLIESLSGGGAEKVLSVLLKHLDREKFDVTLCLVNDVGIYKDEVRPYVRLCSILPDPAGLSGLKFILYKLKYKLIYYWLPTKWVYSLFVPKGADVEVAFTEGFATKIISGTNSKTSRKLAWVHTDYMTNHWTLSRGVFANNEEEKKAYNAFDSIIAVSTSVKTAFESLFGSSIPVKVLYNPFDVGEIHCLSLKEVDCPRRSAFRMITIGRLVPQKAFDRLLMVAFKLKQSGLRFEIFILGDGPCYASLSEAIEDKGLEDSVKLCGFKENPYPYIIASDIFVCSSVAEGLSTSATEALLLGVPVITTDCSGMRDLFGEERCGLITDNSADALYDGIKSVMTDHRLFEELRIGAFNRGRSMALEPRIKEIEKILS